MRQPRLAEMHLRVDDAGQDMQSGAVHYFGRRVANIAQRHDPPVPHRDIGQALAVLVDQGRVLENSVVLRHVWSPPVYL